MDLSLVNFKRDPDINEARKKVWKKRQEEIEVAKRNKIAKLLGFTDKEMNDYIVISLHPVNQIYANNLLELYYQYIIYTNQELIENTIQFYFGCARKLYNAETIHTDESLKNFIESIHPISNDLIDHIAKTPVTMYVYEDILSTSSENYELMAVLPRNNELLERKYGYLPEDEYDRVRQLLVDEKLILSKRYMECEYCHKEGYGDIVIDNSSKKTWICPFCEEEISN